MNTIYIFRGKAATGKTTITDFISQKTNIPIIRKDDFYDILALCEMNNTDRNMTIYEMIQKIITTNINNNCDLIIDISLPHYEYIINFLKPLLNTNTKIINFLCICSDEKEWEKRITARIGSDIPNQGFASFTQAKEHYNKWDYTPLENEIITDSIRSKKIIFDEIKQYFTTL